MNRVIPVIFKVIGGMIKNMMPICFPSDGCGMCINNITSIKQPTETIMDKKRVLITGCSTGIRRALTEEFHESGMCVVATARNVESIADLRDKGIKIQSLDVNQMDQIHEVVDTVLTEEKRIDILANNLTLFAPPENQILFPAGALFFHSPEVWQGPAGIPTGHPAHHLRPRAHH